MKKKKSAVKILTAILLVFVLMIGAAAYLLLQNKDTQDKLNDQISSLKKELAMNSALVYVSTDDLPKGTVLEEGVNVEKQENVTALPNEFYLNEEDLGKTLIVDVPAYAPIMANMVTEEKIAADTREYEVGVANLMVDQNTNDYVDIRIMFPTGEDYIVCSKVKVKTLLLEDSIFYTNLNESEILTLASATIDAFTITGTKIYVTRYVEENLQEQAIPNYPVREETLTLIATDPNVLTVAQQTLNYAARVAMNSKLKDLEKETLAAVNAGHGLIDTASSSAMVKFTEEKVEMIEEGADE